MSGRRGVKLSERLYQGFIYTCLGSSAVSFVYLSGIFYNFFFVKKPEYEASKKLEFEELLKEGREIVEEFKDRAPNVSTN